MSSDKDLVIFYEKKFGWYDCDSSIEYSFEELVAMIITQKFLVRMLIYKKQRKNQAEIVRKISNPQKSEPELTDNHT